MLGIQGRGGFSQPAAKVSWRHGEPHIPGHPQLSLAMKPSQTGTFYWLASLSGLQAGGGGLWCLQSLALGSAG